jgi:hypothetical protein
VNGDEPEQGAGCLKSTAIIVVVWFVGAVGSACSWPPS